MIKFEEKRDGNYKIFEILYNETKIGRIITKEKRDILHISFFNIYKEFENKGYGKLALKEFSFQQLKKYSIIELYVKYDLDKAIKVYFSCGYEIVDTIEDYYVMWKEKGI